MRKLEPLPIAIALSFVFSIFYTACVLVHLLVGGTFWPMYKIWEMVLPGFDWISWSSYFIGLTELFFGGFYVAYVLVPLYNFFEKKLKVNVNEINVVPDVSYSK